MHRHRADFHTGDVVGGVVYLAVIRGPVGLLGPEAMEHILVSRRALVVPRLIWLSSRSKALLLMGYCVGKAWGFWLAIHNTTTGSYTGEQGASSYRPMRSGDELWCLPRRWIPGS